MDVKVGGQTPSARKKKKLGVKARGNSGRVFVM